MTANFLPLSQRARIRIVHGASAPPLMSESDADLHSPYVTRTTTTRLGFSDYGRVHGDPLWTAGTWRETVDLLATLAVSLNCSELHDEPATTESGETETVNGAAASAYEGRNSATKTIASTSEAPRLFPRLFLAVTRVLTFDLCARRGLRIPPSLARIQTPPTFA